MPTVKIATNAADRTCAKCQKAIKAGERSVKDRSERKKGIGEVKYYHPDCYKKERKTK